MTTTVEDDSATGVLWRYLRHEKGLKLSLVESEDLDDMVSDVIDEARRPYVAENQRLRAEVETLRRDVAHADKHAGEMRDAAQAAIRERDEERATEERERRWAKNNVRTLTVERDAALAKVATWERLDCEAYAQRDEALAKLEKVGEYAETLEGWKSGYQCANELLAILDAAPSKLVLTADSDQQSGQFETVTRGVVLYENSRGARYVRSAGHIPEPGEKELDETIVTFHVKRETPKPPRVGEALRKAARRG